MTASSRGRFIWSVTAGILSLRCQDSTTNLPTPSFPYGLLLISVKDEAVSSSSYVLPSCTLIRDLA